MSKQVTVPTAGLVQPTRHTPAGHGAARTPQTQSVGCRGSRPQPRPPLLIDPHSDRVSADAHPRSGARDVSPSRRARAVQLVHFVPGRLRQRRHVASNLLQELEGQEAKSACRLFPAQKSPGSNQCLACGHVKTRRDPWVLCAAFREHVVGQERVSAGTRQLSDAGKLDGSVAPTDGAALEGGATAEEEAAGGELAVIDAQRSLGRLHWAAAEAGGVKAK
eukprot:770253-Prymnesium_polylepis.2